MIPAARRSLLLLVAAGLLLAPTATAAPSSPDLGAEADARRALSAAEDALRAPEPLRGGAVASREATGALRDLAIALPDLDRADRRRARELLSRPTDSNDRDYFGPEAAASPLCDADFCVHWTDKASNAPVSAGFITKVREAAAKSLGVESGELGWRKPKPDGRRGRRGSTGAQGQTDVYITNLGRNLYGFAAPDPGQKGPRRYAYLVLDNDYVGFPTGPVASMQVTVAHELNHILQFRYDTLQDLWMFESTATWMEEQVYPAIDDYLNYLPTFAQGPELPMIGRMKVYADSVWNHWLESRYGPEVVREAWAGSLRIDPRHDSVAAYDRAIGKADGKSFGREFSRFAAVTAEWRASNDFPDAKRYPDMDRDGKLGEGAKSLRLDATAYRLFDVNPGSGRRVRLRVEAPRGVRSAIALVGRKGGTRSGKVKIATRYLPAGGRGRVELPNRGFKRVTAVVIDADGRLVRKGVYAGDDARYSVSAGFAGGR